jgi:hypothetical protein
MFSKLNYNNIKKYDLSRSFFADYGPWVLETSPCLRCSVSFFYKSGLVLFGPGAGCFGIPVLCSCQYGEDRQDFYSGIRINTPELCSGTNKATPENIPGIWHLQCYFTRKER